MATTRKTKKSHAAAPGSSIRIRQRAKGKVYEARWRETDSRTGELRVRARSFSTSDEAKAHLETVRYDRRRGTHVSADRLRTPFRTVAEEWLTAGERKPRTVKVYRHMFGTWLKPWMDQPVSAVGYAEVAGLVAEMRKVRRPQTVHNVFNVAHGILAYAVDAGYVATNPAARVRRNLPKRNDRSERRPFTAEEVLAIAGQLPPPFDLLVRFAAWSGLRAGEIGGLRVARVDVLRGQVQVAETVVRLRGALVPGTPKSEKSKRKVPLPATLVRELQAHIAANGLGLDDYVFGEDDGSPLRHEKFYRMHYRPALAAIGRTDATFHTLRHTYASLMAPHIDMLELSRRMGHQSYAMTADVYSHLYEREDDDKAAVLDAAYASVRVPPQAAGGKVVALEPRKKQIR